MQFLFGVFYTVIALVLLTWIGNLACQELFRRTGLKVDSNSSGDSIPDSASNNIQRAGWIIGFLERLVLAIGIITQRWEVLAAVIALKTVARFKELDNQSFAELFLVGSLFSVLWAVVVTSAWLAFDHHLGTDIKSQLSNLVATQKTELTPCTCLHLTSAAAQNGSIDGVSSHCLGQTPQSNSKLCMPLTQPVSKPTQ